LKQNMRYCRHITPFHILLLNILILFTQELDSVECAEISWRIIIVLLLKSLCFAVANSA